MTLYLVLILAALRFRRRINQLEFLSGILGFFEMANIFLFGRVSFEIMVPYGILVLSLRYIFPEPAVDGPDNMSIMDQETLMQTIRRSGKEKETVIIVCAVASYSDTCKA